jgi:hypothetical protein
MKNLYIKKPFSAIIAMWVVIMLAMVGKTQGQIVAPLTVQLSVFDSVLCYGHNNGFIIITVNGGTPSYTYQWSNGATTSNINSQPAGTYTVTVTDADANTATASTTLHEDSQIVVTATHIDSLKCYGENTGSITIAASGGTLPYTYQWSMNMQDTLTASNLGAGSYQINVSDRYNCGNSMTSFTLNPLPVPEICYVEFDSATSKNSINWPANLPRNMDSIYIFNEVSTNIWNKIGSVSASKGKFIDINSNPYNQSNSYEISAIDTCDKESIVSTPQTTITLIVSYSPTSNSYGFTWSLYQGLPVSNYLLYGIKSNGVETMIDSVPGTQYLYNYTNPNPAYIKFFVGFNAPSCSGS